MHGQRLYHQDMYRFDQPQASYWEATAGPRGLAGRVLEADDSCEVAIIGAGYTGLSAAYHLARDHDIDVRVLDAGHIGWGASGRNGGFCCMGGTSLGSEGLIRKYGAEHARQYYQAQQAAVELVRNIVVDEDIDAQMAGDTELEVAHSPRAMTELARLVEMQTSVLGIDADVISAERFRREYFDASEQFGAARQRPTFGLHPLRYVLGLARAAERHGARLHPESEVVAWRKEGDRHILSTRAATIRSRYVIMATNGFMPEDLSARFRGRPLPMISAIVVTRPLSDAELAAHDWKTHTPAITSRNVMNYFRLLPDKRFLFGGRGSSRGGDGEAESTYHSLAARLRQLWPAWEQVAIDYRWHGLICFTRRQTPAIGRLADDPSVFFAFGYHGNGVNTASWAGQQVASWLAGSSSGDTSIPDSLPVVVRGLSGRFPFPALRLSYLKARLLLFQLEDWWR